MVRWASELFSLPPDEQDLAFRYYSEGQLHRFQEEVLYLAAEVFADLYELALAWGWSWDRYLANVWEFYRLHPSIRRGLLPEHLQRAACVHALASRGPDPAKAPLAIDSADSVIEACGTYLNEVATDQSIGTSLRIALPRLQMAFEVAVEQLDRHLAETTRPADGFTPLDGLQRIIALSSDVAENDPDEREILGLLFFMAEWYRDHRKLLTKAELESLPSVV